MTPQPIYGRMHPPCKPRVVDLRLSLSMKEFMLSAVKCLLERIMLWQASKFLTLNAVLGNLAQTCLLPLHGVPAVNVDGTIYVLGGADRAGAISNQGLVFSLKP